MLNFFLRPLRMFAQALVGNDSPRQTAWAIVLGMLVGLLPKGSLVAIVLAMLLCALQVNRAAGLLAVGVFSYVGAMLDGLAHRIGSMLLTWPAGQATFAWVYDQPFGPFWGITNTVVLGQLVLGLYLLYPTYRISLAITNYVQPRLRERLMKYRIIRWLKGAEVGAQWGLGS
jgi:uncharacterized protein (TIGR03546 family)